MENNSTTYIILVIVIIIILCATTYYYYWFPQQANINLYKIPLVIDETIFDEQYTKTILLEPLITSRNTLLVPKLGYGLTFSWDMYIPSQGGNDKWQHTFNNLKPIISFSDSPVISYHPKKNYLSIVLKYRDNPFYTQFAEVKFPDIKPQRWSSYIIIIDNRNIILYIDSKLVANKILPSVPVIYDMNTDIILGEQNNNFQGKIRNLILYPYPLSYNEVLKI